jgi:hypothetical protein
MLSHGGLRSHVTAEKTDHLKNHHKSKENFSAFSPLGEQNFRNSEHPVEMVQYENIYLHMKFVLLIITIQC